RTARPARLRRCRCGCDAARARCRPAPCTCGAFRPGQWRRPSNRRTPQAPASPAPRSRRSAIPRRAGWVFGKHSSCAPPAGLAPGEQGFPKLQAVLPDAIVEFLPRILSGRGGGNAFGTVPDGLADDAVEFLVATALHDL